MAIDSATKNENDNHSSQPINLIENDPQYDRPTPEATHPQVTRPISKQWHTERPQPTAKVSLDHTFRLKRHETNIPTFGSPYDFSTSSSSDEDDFSEQRRNGRPRRYGDKRAGTYSKFNVGNEDFNTNGRVSQRDGRLKISLNETNNRGYLAKALGASFLHNESHVSAIGSGPEAPTQQSSAPKAATAERPQPKLSIVIMVLGSRGDVQPFLKIGKCLKEYGHRVRIATHPAFKEFVQKDSGLEFFSVGGDPAELIAFMVKNPSMIPKISTITGGEIGRRREQMAEMFEGFWRACINATDDEKDLSNLKMMGKRAPFVADAIIANPPCFAHVHCAERLGIPLHLMFTFPYTPTQAFPHPLAIIKKTNVDPTYANFISYPLVEMMAWQGLGDLVNDFRVKTLGLEPVSTLWAPGQLYRLKVPYTYLWSPALIPKPRDWGTEINIAGFVFLDLASSFKPPKELVEFLDAGEPPIYIGFGSIVVDNPEEFTKMIFEAVRIAGVRALVSKGWGGLGEGNIPKGIYLLENTPHDWLFPRVSAVVHHGGAGTTAIGLKSGRPTMIVPFFGDQQFWGAMISKSGAGAQPVPHKNLTANKLADGIKRCLTEKARKAAEKYAKDVEAEGDGAHNAVLSFHRSLVLGSQRSMRCSILEDRVAVWVLKNTSTCFSALAAEILVEKKIISWKQLRLIRHCEWNDFEGPGEPLSGGLAAALRTVAGIVSGVGGVPVKITKIAKKRTRHEEKKERKLKEPGGGETRYKLGTGDHRNTMIDNKKSIDLDLEEQAKSKENQVPGVVDGMGDSDTKVIGHSGMSKHTTSGQPLSEEQERSHEARHQSDNLDLSDDRGEPFAVDVAQAVSSGVGKTAEAIVRAPMDLSLAVAQGFHNAPRLYGDKTVRRPTRITGIKSGLKAAGEEFVFGVYDGFSGLVIQPYTGARDDGVTGFLKGVSMGLTGFVLKDLAAIFGPFGHTFKGIHKEFLKRKQPTNFIRKARILEGQRDLEELNEEEAKQTIETVCRGWSVIQQAQETIAETHSPTLWSKLHVMKEHKN